MNGFISRWRDLDRLGKGLILVTIAGALGCLIGAFGNLRQVLLGYLAVYQFYLGLSLGSLALLMLHRLTGGTWGESIQSPLQAMTQTLPLLAILFLPLLFGLREVYVWTQPEMVAASDLLQKKQWYLNVPFFLIRAAVYFTFWVGFASAFRRWTDAWERSDDPGLESRLRRLSAGGLIVLGLTMTFAAVDWIMTLTPEWFSSTFGLLITAGHALSALALAIICAAGLSQWTAGLERATPNCFQDLGSLLLMLLLLWTYLALMQYLTIWVGNQPSEIAWYLPRVQTSWQRLGVFLILFHLAVPFLLLLSRHAKRNAIVLAGIAMVVLVAHLADAFWLVVPSFRHSGFALYWTDGAALFAVGGLWTGFFLRQLRTQSASVEPIKAHEVISHGG